MEEIRFIVTPDCRECAFEIKLASKRKQEKIIEDRKHIPKCKGCQRPINQIITSHKRQGGLVNCQID